MWHVNISFSRSVKTSVASISNKMFKMNHLPEIFKELFQAFSQILILKQVYEQFLKPSELACECVCVCVCAQIHQQVKIVAFAAH